MSLDQLHLLLRVTARISIALFLPGFAGVALGKLFPERRDAAWLARNSQRFILTFAASHTVHLGLILYGAAAVPEFRAMLIPAVVIGGGAGFVFVYIAAFFALLRVRGREPGRAAGRVESVALYVLWTAFALVNFSKLAQPATVYGVYAVLLVAALAVRLAGNLKAEPKSAAAGVSH